MLEIDGVTRTRGTREAPRARRTNRRGYRPAAGGANRAPPAELSCPVGPWTHPVDLRFSDPLRSAVHRLLRFAAAAGSDV